MNAPMLISNFGVARGELLRFVNAEGVLVHVRAGSIWLTQHGHGNDIVLRAGQTFDLARPDLALAQALAGIIIDQRFQGSFRKWNISFSITLLGSGNIIISPCIRAFFIHGMFSAYDHWPRSACGPSPALGLAFDERQTSLSDNPSCG